MLEAGLVEPPFKPDVSTRMIYTSYDKENNTNTVSARVLYLEYLDPFLKAEIPKCQHIPSQTTYKKYRSI